MIPTSNRSKKFRTLFLSDVHLGTRNCQAEALLDFLKHNTAEQIVLVGDIVDFWKVKRGAYWPQSHNDVIQKLLRAVRKGTRMIFIPGNHDEALRAYCGQRFGGIEVRRDYVHTTADGRRYLVMHGDEFDVVVRGTPLIAFIGDIGYDLAILANRPLNWIRRKLGFGYWSLAGFLKQCVKRAVSFISAFEQAVVNEAKERDTQGAICGHIHCPCDRMIEGVHYINCGDWIENCTAIGETDSGDLELIYWPATMSDSRRDGRAFPTLEAA